MRRELETNELVARLRMALVAQMETTRALIEASRQLLAKAPHRVAAAAAATCGASAALAAQQGGRSDR